MSAVDGSTQLPPVTTTAAPIVGERWSTLRRLLRHRLFVTGLILFGIIVVVAILAPVIAPTDPNKLAMRNKFLPPSWEYPFGTDNFGRSQLSRVVWGARLSIVMGVSVVA